LRQEVRLKS